MILDAPDLDPITVFIEEPEPGKARITIEVYGDDWSYYWGNMGAGVTAREFFNDIPYLANKFCRGDTREPDYGKLARFIGMDEDELKTQGLYAHQGNHRVPLPKKNRGGNHSSIQARSRAGRLDGW